MATNAGSERMSCRTLEAVGDSIQAGQPGLPGPTAAANDWNTQAQSKPKMIAEQADTARRQLEHETQRIVTTSNLLQLHSIVLSTNGIM